MALRALGGFTVAVCVCVVASGGTSKSKQALATVKVEWTQCDVTRTTVPGVLVAADPEWLPDAKLYAAATAGTRALARAGGALRLLNFNIFPAISCPQLDEGTWDFAYSDQVMSAFMDGAGDTSPLVIVDLETSPSWMWADANATDTHTCADNVSITRPVGPRTRCPHYGNPNTPKDPSWRQIATYNKNVADWYTRRGFRDPRTENHYHSNHSYDWDYFEILNEPQLTREHGFSPQSVIDFYDEQVRVFDTDGAPARKWMGSSFSGMHNAEVADAWVAPFLNRSHHHPPTTPVDALSFHIYANCLGDNSPKGMEHVFPTTDAGLAGLQRVAELKQALRPDVELHLTESGLICNAPRECGSNNYTCWFRSFNKEYWVASAAQWVYQFLTYSHAADLVSVSHSQILGYPYRFDGLSGEWPCGTMVDWNTAELNAKFWITLLTLERIGRPFRFCSTTTTAAAAQAMPPTEATTENSTRGQVPVADDMVFAQGIDSDKGRLLVLINKKSTSVTVHIAGASGKHAAVLDSTVGNRPAKNTTLTSDDISMAAFATMFVSWQ
eukprot:m.33874 g.33874  ORF g.33874 m.33874 type:complete len:555 (+) comp10536_c0_seq1:149-1813(+)